MGERTNPTGIGGWGEDFRERNEPLFKGTVPLDGTGRTELKSPARFERIPKVKRTAKTQQHTVHGGELVAEGNAQETYFSTETYGGSGSRRKKARGGEGV